MLCTSGGWCLTRSYVPLTQIDDVGKFAVLVDLIGAAFAVIKLDPRHV